MLPTKPPFSPRERDLLERITELGLFRRGAPEVYVSLLSQGPQSMADLQHLGFRSAQLQAGCAQLVEMGLVSEDSGKHGRRILLAVDPDVAWNAKVAELIWSQKTTLGPITDLPSVCDPLVDRLRERFETVSLLAQGLQSDDASIPLRRKSRALGPAALASRTAFVISKGTREIRGMMTGPRLPYVPLTWTVISDRLRDGVTCLRITDYDEFSEHGLAIVRRDVYGTGVRLRIAERSLLTRTFYVVDNRYVVLHHDVAEGADWRAIRGHVSERRSSGGRGMILRYREYFDQVYERAVDARLVISAFQEDVEERLRHLAREMGPIEQAWLYDIVRMGAFSRFASEHPEYRWSPEREEGAAQRAKKLRLLKRGLYGRLVFDYSLGESVLEQVRAGEGGKEEEPCEACWEPLRRCMC